MSLHSFSAPRINAEQLRKEFAAMSEEQREQARRDIYGREPAIDETPAFLQDALERLEQALDSVTESEAFELAQIHCPDYVNGNEFRLMFLRSARFDVQLTAEKIVKYWDRKVILFGTDRAFRKLSINDLDEEDQIALNQGGFQALPERDEFGRGIIFCCRAKYDSRTTHRMSMLRVGWLLLHELAEDVEVQRNGIICLLEAAGQSPNTIVLKFDAKFGRMAWRDIGVLPISIKATHRSVCSEGVLALITEITLFAMGSNMRARYCQHSGSTEKILQQLEVYGIGSDIVPGEMGGTLDFDYHEWLEETRQRAV